MKNLIYSYMNNKWKYYYKCNYFYFFLIKGLIKVYVIILIKQRNNIPDGITSNIACIIMSLSFSMSVQL